MAPKIVDKQEKRRQLALVALELFADQGFEATSMTRVAQAAGISKGAIYLYYGSKAELVAGAAEAWVAGIGGGVSRVAPGGGDPLLRLRTLLRATTRAFLEEPRMGRLFLGMMEAAARRPEAFADLALARRVSAPVREAVAGILRDGVAQGFLRPEVADDAPRLAINLVAFVDGLGLHHVGCPGTFDLDGQLDLFLEGLIDGLRLRPPGPRVHPSGPRARPAKGGDHG